MTAGEPGDDGPAEQHPGGDHHPSSTAESHHVGPALMEAIPAGGLGLTGPGAEPAARGRLIAALSPADPDVRGQVIVPVDTLAALLGADSATVDPIPHLTVTATLAEAILTIEELLITRQRRLYETDPAEASTATTDLARPLPPVLLITAAPPSSLQPRLTTALHLGAPLHISAIVLGDWPPGDTATIPADGRIGGERLTVLDAATTRQLLDVLREAYPSPDTPGSRPDPDSADSQPDPHTVVPTAEAPPRATTTTAPADDVASTATSSTGPSRSAAAADNLNGAAVTPQPTRQPAAVRIRILGPPAILDRDGQPGTGLRHHARQLLVFLAVHRRGANLPDIMEAFWPTATLRRASERLSTEASDLRRHLRRAAGDTKVQPVINTGGRYHLNPDLLDIDLWQLSDSLRRAAAAVAPGGRRTALRQAVHAGTGLLADGYDYDWIEQPREHARRLAVRAHLHLANELADTDPHEAATLAQAAADLDPYSEDAARQAMQALARVGDTAAVQARMLQLREALHQIDAEPSDETVALTARPRFGSLSAGRAPADSAPPP